VPVPEIDAKHAALLAGGLDLGSEIGPEDELYDGGFAQSYAFGRIWFHPRIGEAFEVHGLILSTYLGRDGERGELGYPISDEFEDVGTVGGRISSFEQGALFFDPATGVEAVFDESVLVPQVTVKVEDGTFVPLGPGGRLSLDKFASAIVGPGFEGVLGLIAALLPDLKFRRASTPTRATTSRR
jgi:uncharacterized protein with LGFP repeats